MISYRMVRLKMDNNAGLRFGLYSAFIVRNFEHIRAIIVDLVSSRCVGFVLQQHQTTGVFMLLDFSEINALNVKSDIEALRLSHSLKEDIIASWALNFKMRNRNHADYVRRKSNFDQKS